MDINALKTFLEVAKIRHFGRAAEALFVSQSTVSARIQALEEALGAELFIRDRGNIRLTPGGEALVTHAQSMMTLWSRAKQEISSSDAIRQTMSFGGLSGLWDEILQDWLARIRTEHTSLAISADIYPAETLVSRVLDRTMDLAFLFDAPNHVSLEVRALKPIKLRMVSSEKVLKLDEHWGDKYVAVDWGASFAVQFATEYPDVQSAGLITSLGRIAQEHLKRFPGFAYLAEPAVKQAIKRQELFYVPNTPVFKRTPHAVYLADSPKAEFLESLLLSF